MPDSYELCDCYKFVKHSEGMGRFARFLDKSRYIDFFVFSLFFVLFYIEVSGSVVKNYHTFKGPKGPNWSLTIVVRVNRVEFRTEIFP